MATLALYSLNRSGQNDDLQNRCGSFNLPHLSLSIVFFLRAFGDFIFLHLFFLLLVFLSSLAGSATIFFSFLWGFFFCLFACHLQLLLELFEPG